MRLRDDAALRVSGVIHPLSFLIDSSLAELIPDLATQISRYTTQGDLFDFSE